MRVIPVDDRRIKVLVVGEPTAQERDGQPMLDRNTKQPLWSLDVTIIGTSRAETIQLTLPEGGFPKNIGVGAVIVPERWWRSPGRRTAGPASWSERSP